MITGVETAGLILAVLPLIISALEHYTEGLKPLKDFVRYKAVIRDLIVDLGTQRALFRNTLEKLLSGLVASEGELAHLLENPGGVEWRDKKLAGDLRQRLQGSFTAYMESVEDMDSLVKSFKDKMGLDNWGKPGWIDARSHKKAWKKFVMCLSKKEHEALLARMEKDNRNLKNLTKDSLDLEPIRQSRRRASEPFRKIRDYARSLHSVLKLGWSCTCRNPHSANLRLEMRDCGAAPSFRVLFPFTNHSSTTPTWQETDIRPLNDGENRTLRHHSDEADLQLAAGLASVTLSSTNAKSHMAMVSSSYILSAVGKSPIDQNNLHSRRGARAAAVAKKVAWASETQEKWDQPRGNSLSSGDGPTESRVVLAPNQASHSAMDSLRLTKIANLCHALHQFQCDERHEICLGCLVHEDRSLGVYALRQQPRSWANTVTLHDILKRPSSRSSNHGVSTPQMDVSAIPHLSKKHRLQLAVTLASTALQLQTTPWLESKWSKEDILFHNGLPEHPYISKTFEKDANAMEAPDHPKKDFSSPIRNESMFNLGVILLELSFGKSLDQLKIEEDPDIYTEYAIARRLVDTLADEESPGYANAAWACIYCDFGSKVKSPSLDNEAFRQAVYDDVVVPLEEEWKHWNGIST